jgi:TRAP transporter TAXI family solute receptor
MFVACAGLILSACAGGRPGQKYDLTIAGGSPKGVWSILGNALDKAMAATHPVSSVAYKNSGGSIANIGLIDRRQADLAFASSGDMHLAETGAGPFNKKITSARVVARIHAWLYFHPILRKAVADKYGIKDFADIATKKPPIRISVNRRGLLISVVAEAMLKDIGVTPGDIERWGGKVVYAASRDTTSLMLEHKLDGHMMIWPLKHRRLRQMEESEPMVLLSVNDRSISRRVAKQLNMSLDTVPGGTYKSQPADLLVPSIEGNIILHKDAKDQVAYDIAKAIHLNLADFASAHPFLRNLRPKFLAGGKGRYHPGAIKYYKEAGLM